MVFHSRRNYPAIETIDDGVAETGCHAPFWTSGGRQLATGLTSTLRLGAWFMESRHSRVERGGAVIVGNIDTVLCKFCCCLLSVCWWRFLLLVVLIFLFKVFVGVFFVFRWFPTGVVMYSDTIWWQFGIQQLP